MNEKALVKKPVDRLKAIIAQSTVKEQFNNALGKHSDSFVASLIDVFNGGLQNMDPSLVIQEALKAAVLKLPISKDLGFAYIVPYKGKPKFDIGYKGMIQLAMRSGQVKILNPDVVYEGEFKGIDKLTGVADFSGEKKSDKVVGYFCYMELINGFHKTIYWSKEKVIAHAEKKSPSYKSRKSAWTTDFDAMALKTVIRAINKYMPMSVEFLAIPQLDEELGEDESVVNANNVDHVNVSFEEETEATQDSQKTEAEQIEDFNESGPDF
jgi:recombination protein RecT